MENIKEYFLVEPKDDYNDEDMTSVFMNGVYFHGQLEKDLGYDLVRVEGLKLLNKFYLAMQTINKSFKSKVKVNNEFKDCVVFFWLGNEDNRPHGLITYEDDEEFFNDAKEKYKARVNFL